MLTLAHGAIGPCQLPRIGHMDACTHACKENAAGSVRTRLSAPALEDEGRGGGGPELKGLPHNPAGTLLPNQGACYEGTVLRDLEGLPNRRACCCCVQYHSANARPTKRKRDRSKMVMSLLRKRAWASAFRFSLSSDWRISLRPLCSYAIIR